MRVKSGVEFKQVRFSLTDDHLKRLDKARKTLGFATRSELMRFFALYAEEFAKSYLHGGLRRGG